MDNRILKLSSLWHLNLVYLELWQGDKIYKLLSPKAILKCSSFKETNPCHINMSQIIDKELMHGQKIQQAFKADASY